MIFNVRKGKKQVIVISLIVSGSWSHTQYTSSAVDTTGLTFTATYNNGSTASVSPSVSPSTWSSTAGTQTATFSYTENGVTVSATKDASVVSPHNWSSWKNVGGTIFYINPSSTGSYEFKNSSGTVVSAPSVGTDCTNWTYRYDLNDYNVDKFYVYYTLIPIGTSNYWSYLSKTYAYGNSIGAGKTNTSTVMAITDTSGWASVSIWKYIRDMRTNKTNGCDDWFVGCEAEVEQLRLSGTTGASWFAAPSTNSNGIWSSTEVQTSYQKARGWSHRGQNWSNWSKTGQCGLVPFRAF